MEDHLIARERNYPEVDDAPAIKDQNLRIDRAIIARRMALKRALPQTRRLPDLEGPYIREFEKYPHFHAAYWSFPSVVRWVAERTEKSANGVYVDQDHIVPALTEIQKALKSGAARRGAARCERGRFTHSPKAAKPPTWAAS